MQGNLNKLRTDQARDLEQKGSDHRSVSKDTG